MRKWKGPGKGMGILFLTAALVCSAVQPVFAEEDGADSPSAEVPGTKIEDENTLKEEVSEEELRENDSELQPLAVNEGTQPSVAADSVTWEGGMLKIPVDLGSYTADEILPILRFAPENTDVSEWWRYPALEGGYAVYSPMLDFESCDVETFWTKKGTYDVTMEFHLLSDSEKLICTDSFTITIPFSSEMWQVEEKSVKFDGSQDLTFSFKNGTNYYELKAIDHIQLFMWKNPEYEDPAFGNGFTFDMSAGTLAIDKNIVRDELIRAVQEAQKKGLDTFPTSAYVNAVAVTSSGEEIRFNVIDKVEDDWTLHVPAWELDLTDFDWTAEELEIVPEATDYSYMKGDRDGATIKCTGALDDFESVQVDGVLVDPGNYTLESGSTILTFTAKYLNTLSVGKHTVTMNYTYGSVNTDLTVHAQISSGGSSSGGSGSGSTGKPDSSRPASPANPSEPAAPAPANPAGTTTTVATAPANGTNASGNITSVQTGDNTPGRLWVLSAMFALCVCGVLGWKRCSCKH